MEAFLASIHPVLLLVIGCAIGMFGCFIITMLNSKSNNHESNHSLGNDNIIRSDRVEEPEEDEDELKEVKDELKKVDNQLDEAKEGLLLLKGEEL